MNLWCGHHTARSCAIFSLFVFCSLFPATPVLADGCDARRAQVPGWWEWVSTTTAWTGQVTTPATEGYTLQFELRSDGSCDFYRDEEFDGTGTWQVQPNSDRVNDPSVSCRFDVDTPESPYSPYTGLLRFESDQMVWDNGHLDGSTIRVERRTAVSTESISWGMFKAERAGN